MDAAAGWALVVVCFGRFVVPGLASRRPGHAASRMKARTAGVSAQASIVAEAERRHQFGLTSIAPPSRASGGADWAAVEIAL